MKLILRLIGLKMSILRVDAAIINPKTVKPNLYPSRIIVGTDMEDERLVEAAHEMLVIEAGKKNVGKEEQIKFLFKLDGRIRDLYEVIFNNCLM